ncbi:hypothetical protein MF271_04935 [Deinococcus sp. KNUC1210]|uniref:hypothetical protein n=1 Tax=Deinococcus sp. KNUC1210 TaxID=2917691 RepID=UPI001EF10EC1|nr:hypothetical protein [Deinococcus sp. KNUC1210]ULH15980.1 hypothetical protein MF271_04935 [Deinococcus sp. KNUC1210]
MNQLVDLLTNLTGGKITVTGVLKLAPVLEPIIADLALDGDTHLSAEHRQVIQEAIHDLEVSGGLA